MPGGPNYRRAAFLSGLSACGFSIADQAFDPRPGDVLVVWNRSASTRAECQRFESRGAAVLVTENGYLGKQWMGRKWFSLAIGHHSGAGDWHPEGGSRWDGWGVDLKPWREDGEDTLILAQRGIGEPGIASPLAWAESVQKRYGGRIRQHPGANAPRISLADDLAKAARVLTWHSSAALLALIEGIPAWHQFSAWIGAPASNHLSLWGSVPDKRDDADRLFMFQRLAWAMWTEEEIASGYPFERLACRTSW